jgi:hypothetical protein
MKFIPFLITVATLLLSRYLHQNFNISAFSVSFMFCTFYHLIINRIVKDSVTLRESLV